MRRYGGRANWVQVAVRPARAMRTVILDSEQKRHVLADVNEYLHPATPRWYANRGIPLRRGYLFYGPPGTGKTSLSFALAGVFGLDINVISLQEPSLTEEDLAGLFSNLPRRCVVLLEDIDTAGLSRNRPTGGNKSGADSGAGGEDNKDNPGGISLSGLLNAIDGVASHEGRVLIMTTNKPESLDPALIRPGRVDLQVGFTNATKFQARELFERMFESDDALVAARRATFGTPSAADTKPAPTAGPQKVATAKEAADKEAESDDSGVEVDQSPSGQPKKAAGRIPGTKGGDASFDWRVTEAGAFAPHKNEHLSSDEIKELARDFADQIPDLVFSPAELQGFLLKRKNKPRLAVAEVAEWAEALKRHKEGGKKVMEVQ
jgi:mitochondrial chaperone BCS1